MANWLHKLFASKPDTDEEENGNEIDDFEEEPGFVWNEHMRIVLAIIVVVISAIVMWWILI